MDDTETTILRCLMKVDCPVTTEMVAKEAGMARNTAQVHPRKFVSQGLVRGKKVGGHKPVDDYRCW